MRVEWMLEDDVNDWIKTELENIGLVKLQDYNVESAMSDYMKEALRGSAKTKKKSNFGKPDIHIEKYDKIPIIFENKLGLKKLINESKDGIKNDEKAIAAYAVNGAIYYANQMIASGKYDEVIAIGVAGDNKENVAIHKYIMYMVRL